ncbi:MAG: hypothetical protein AYP45_12705 [Candidatus Brocadia carolinensis]|uniref:Uncharacterized protein n=1 Tax=Candidatus Brocadia carolinensis TaxID=1004156 RepID=A0A1V4ARU3_9BACT|nr:MAG: hypothetical protein AYP45_12705 [Candidatus Brocadia caroliniensis]
MKFLYIKLTLTGFETLSGLTRISNVIARVFSEAISRFHNGELGAALLRYEIGFKVNISKCIAPAYDLKHYRQRPGRKEDNKKKQKYGFRPYSISVKKRCVIGYWINA